MHNEERLVEIVKRTQMLQSMIKDNLDDFLFIVGPRDTSLLVLNYETRQPVLFILPYYFDQTKYVITVNSLGKQDNSLVVKAAQIAFDSEEMPNYLTMSFNQSENRLLVGDEAVQKQTNQEMN